MVTRVSDATYGVYAVDNPRKHKVVHFNRLKLCSESQPVDKRHVDDQSASYASNPPVWRPHLLPRHLTDETDLMYMDETAANVAVEIPRQNKNHQQ